MRTQGRWGRAPANPATVTCALPATQLTDVVTVKMMIMNFAYYTTDKGHLCFNITDKGRMIVPE